MTRSYDDEIAAFPETYAWASTVDVEPLRSQVEAAANRGLLAVGSGGSWTAAHFAAYLHQVCTPHLSQAVTPLQMSGLRNVIRSVAVLLLSARGQNPDILTAARFAIEHEPRELTAIIFAAHSPLRRLLEKYSFTVTAEFASPLARDGFLSTNSLLAALIILYRAYAAVYGLEILPCSYSDLNSLFDAPSVPSAFRDRTLLVLFGTDTAAGAYDLESKMSEAALGHVLLSDYRDFAHGRHYWLARRAASSAVVAFSSADDTELAVDTLRHFPSEIPRLSIATATSGPMAGIVSVIGAMQFIASLASRGETNIARPGVPTFGRRLYHSRALARSRRAFGLDRVAICRKAAATASVSSGTTVDWASHYATFINRSRDAQIRSVVVDYDGTLCGAAERFTGIGDVVADLLRLLESGMPIGIATGRGASAADDLRLKLPMQLWPRMTVGYYNGAYIRRLDQPFDTTEMLENNDLSCLAEALRRDNVLAAVADIRVGRGQITIRAKRRADIPVSWLAANSVMTRSGLTSLEIVQSSHSIDVISRHRSKCAVVEHMASAHAATVAEILCIGDKGLWPGNDYRLLQMPLSFSVDEVSPDPGTCWNVSPPGWRGPQATRFVLSRLRRTRRSIFRLGFPT